MPTIINHDHPESVRLRSMLGKNKYNGAYYYSNEICEFFIPKIETDRNWITIRAGEAAVDHSIVFVHDIFKFEEKYSYLFKYDDIVYVVSFPWLVEEAERHGKAAFIPLSINVPYVERFKSDKDKGTAFAGRSEWRVGIDFPEGTDFIEMMPRNELLKRMARYEKVYATSRTALEALVLGCEVLPYHPAFPDPSVWKVVDSREAAAILQERLDEIDGRR